MYTFVYRTFIKFILFCRGQALDVFATGGWGEKSSWLRYLRTVLRSKPVRDEIFEIEYPFWLKSLISLIWDIVSISFPPLPLVVLRQRISDRLFCFKMSLSDFEEFPLWYWGILSPISGTFIIRYTSSKSEGKFPTFRSGNPHYPKETCREFSFFSLSKAQVPVPGKKI